MRSILALFLHSILLLQGVQSSTTSRLSFLPTVSEDLVNRRLKIVVSTLNLWIFSLYSLLSTGISTCWAILGLSFSIYLPVCSLHPLSFIKRSRWIIQPNPPLVETRKLIQSFSQNTRVQTSQPLLPIVASFCFNLSDPSSEKKLLPGPNQLPQSCHPWRDSRRNFHDP